MWLIADAPCCFGENSFLVEFSRSELKKKSNCSIYLFKKNQRLRSSLPLRKISFSQKSINIKLQRILGDLYSKRVFKKTLFNVEVYSISVKVTPGISLR